MLENFHFQNIMNKKYMYVVIFYVLYVNNKQTKGTIQNIHIILLQTVNHSDTCTCTGRKYKREIILYNYEISTTAIPYIMSISMVLWVAVLEKFHCIKI